MINLDMNTHHYHTNINVMNKKHSKYTFSGLKQAYESFKVISRSN